MKIDQSIAKKLTEHAKKSLLHAQKIAHSAGATQIKAEHLFYSIYLQKGSVGGTILANMKLSKSNFEKEIFKSSKSPKKVSTSLSAQKPLPLTATLRNIITDAYASAADFGYPYVGTEHFIYALLEKPNPIIKRILEETDRTNAEPNSSDQTYGQSFSPEMLSHMGHILRGDNFSFLKNNEEIDTGTIEQFTTDASKNEPSNPFIGQSEAVSRIATILGRKTKNNPLLIGDPGVGKTALIEHLARLTENPHAPAHIRGKRILTLDLALLVAGTSFRGEFEQRLKDVIAEAGNAPEIILFIDELHTIIGTGNTGGSLDAANILKPALARGNIKIIGATTHEEYKKHISKDAALARRFQRVHLTQPTVNETIEILSEAKEAYEEFHSVKFTKESLQTAAKLSERFMPEQNFPDKAFDVIDETAAYFFSINRNNKLYESLGEIKLLIKDLAEQKTNLLRAHQYDAASIIQKQETQANKKYTEIEAKIAKYEKKTKATITHDDISETVARMTGIPHDIIIQKPGTRILQAKKTLEREIIGQENAIEVVTKTLARSAVGLSNAQRPQGSFLFLGPTSVGKTLTAKILAKEIYGNEDALIRIDMSELMEKHNTSKLVGAPAGYIGYGEGGTLTEKIKKRPYSVVLFDEIEKAHPDTFNLLLQILEEGTLTDGEGMEADFRHAIIILTSNIGATAHSAESLGFEEDHQAKNQKQIRQFEKEVKNTLPPELISRLDHIVTYNTLTEKSLTKIAKQEIERIAEKLQAKKITLTCTPSVYKEIAKKAHTSGNSARGVRKIVQDEVETKMSDYLIENESAKKAHLTLSNDEITITKTKSKK